MRLLPFLVLLTLIGACSSIKTRKEVKEEKQAQMIESGEADPGPPDDQVLDDSLAELGIDPNTVLEDKE